MAGRKINTLSAVNGKLKTKTGKIGKMLIRIAEKINNPNPIRIYGRDLFRFNPIRLNPSTTIRYGINMASADFIILKERSKPGSQRSLKNPNPPRKNIEAAKWPKTGRNRANVADGYDPPSASLSD